MNTLIELLTQQGILLIFAITFAARVGLPLPAAPLLVVAGGLAAAGALSWPALLVAAILANLLGDAVWYQAGRVYGHRVMRLLCRISLSPDSCVRQSESLIDRWGGSALLAAKFLPGISVVAAPMAGALGMSLRRFVCFDLVAGALWSAGFLALGLLLSEQVQQTLEMLADAGIAALLILLLLVAALVLRRWWRRRQFLLNVVATRISVNDAVELIEKGLEPVFIDVRSEASRAIDRRRIPGALLLEALADRRAKTTGELPRDRELVLYCNCPNDVSAALAAKALSSEGFTRVRALAGGLDGWAAAGHPTEDN
jgi:membrane protein DedA with SNARE-associated domain/rhodanese-related sulfurtransferase